MSHFIILKTREPSRDITCTEWCESIPACLNFRCLAPASLSYQPQPAKAAIFGKIGRKTINLAGLFLHNGVHMFVQCCTVESQKKVQGFVQRKYWAVLFLDQRRLWCK